MITKRQERRLERNRDKAERHLHRQLAEAKRQRGKHKPPPERPRFVERGPTTNYALLAGMVSLALSTHERNTK